MKMANVTTGPTNGNIFTSNCVFGTVLDTTERMQKKISPFKGLRAGVRRQMNAHTMLLVKNLFTLNR